MLVTPDRPSARATVGDGQPMPRYKPIPSLTEAQTARFWDSVDRSGSTCWEWLGAFHSSGYGLFGRHRAHRVSYAIHHGSAPLDMPLDHLCRNISCVNPAHLEAVTIAENTRRGGGLRTECPSGHLLDASNLRVSVRGGRLRRECRTCVRQQLRVQWRLGLRKRGRNG